MANFNKPPAPEPTTMDEVLTLAPAPFAVESPSLSPAGHTAGFVTIGEGTRITGVIDNCTTIDVRGMFDGDVIADLVIVRDGGGISGRILAGNAEICGTVEGTLNLTEHWEVKSNGKVRGDVTSGTTTVDMCEDFQCAID